MLVQLAQFSTMGEGNSKIGERLFYNLVSNQKQGNGVISTRDEESDPVAKALLSSLRLLGQKSGFGNTTCLKLALLRYIDCAANSHTAADILEHNLPSNVRAHNLCHPRERKFVY